MLQVPARVRRLTALAAFFTLTGHAAQAGVVAMPQWGAAPGAAHPSAADAARCLEIEEVTARGRGGIRFQATWSRDASCQGTAATAGTPGPAASTAPTPAAQTPAAAPTGSAPPLPAPPAPAAPAAPAAPPASPAAVAPSTQAPPAAPTNAPSAPPAPAPAVAPAPAPVAPTPQAPEGPATVPSSPPTPPAQDTAPPRSAPEASVPEAIVISPEQPQGANPAPGITSPAHELTGIAPPPIAELRPPPTGTVPEPSSLWLLALGVAAAWRSRRR